MSIGIGGIANLVLEDSQTIIYEYGGYNLNEPEYINRERICDGIITIPRHCFAEPKITEKIKRMPSGRKKKITKRIPVDVEYGDFLEKGIIKIDNYSNCWKSIQFGSAYIDETALHILFKLFNDYQVNGEMPSCIVYFK